MSNPEKVSRLIIKKQIFEKFESFTEPEREITEETNLQLDLGMSSTFRQALALPFTKISKRYGGYTIKINEAKRLKTVKDCIDLVYKKANRSK